MFKKGLLLIGVTMLVVTIPSFLNSYAYLTSLPSSYENGVRLETAFQKARQDKKPLLIEFYSDTCQTCREVTPVLHAVYRQGYSQKLHWVMLDMASPDNAPFAQLFGVETLPAAYVFDPARMKKTAIPLDTLAVRERLDRFLNQTLSVNPATLPLESR